MLVAPRIADEGSETFSNLAEVILKKYEIDLFCSLFAENLFVT